MRPTGRRPKAYGLTGGIATGKSTVSSFFKALGGVVIDADLVSRKVCQKGKPAWQKIKDAFGEGVFQEDGSLDRQKLAQIVFNDLRVCDPEKRKKLEAITHPFIMEEIRSEIRKFFDQGKPIVLVEAALLFESGYDKEFDGIIVVTCKPHQQMERLLARSNISKAEAGSIIQSQMPMDEKVKKATFVIDNSGSIEHTKHAVAEVFSKIKPKKSKNSLWH